MPLSGFYRWMASNREKQDPFNVAESAGLNPGGFNQSVGDAVQTGIGKVKSFADSLKPIAKNVATGAGAAVSNAKTKKQALDEILGE